MQSCSFLWGWAVWLWINPKRMPYLTFLKMGAVMNPILKKTVQSVAAVLLFCILAALLLRLTSPQL